AGLAIGTKRSYLASCIGTCRCTPVVNPQERNEDDSIHDLHHPCRLFARTHRPASRQTLARGLSPETNVTSVTTSSQSSDRTPSVAARMCESLSCYRFLARAMCKW